MKLDVGGEQVGKFNLGGQNGGLSPVLVYHYPPRLDFAAYPGLSRLIFERMGITMSVLTTKKAIWWSVTAFNDEIELCEGTLPEYIRAIYGGRETCPDTGRLHFQGAIQCFEQVRMSKIKSWLKTAHLEPARSSEALKKYAMKADTAAGEKVVRNNPIPHYSAHEMCLLLAQTSRQPDIGFWDRAKTLLAKTPELAGQLMNPSLRGFFEKTQSVWLDRAAIVLQQPAGAPPGCECGKDECLVCYEKETESNSITHAPPTETPSDEEASDQVESTPESGVGVHGVDSTGTVVVHK